MENQLLNHIIERCVQGDHSAQKELYSRYCKAMYSVSMRILNHSAEAEDAMQDAFISAFRQLHAFKGDVSFGSWLKRIVVNRSIDLLRKRKIQYENVEVLTNQASEDGAEPDENLTAEMVKQAIASLQDNYRVVLSLFLLEGYDHDEIAGILKISNGSSRIIYHRAKEKLKVLLMEMKPV